MDKKTILTILAIATLGASSLSFCMKPKKTNFQLAKEAHEREIERIKQESLKDTRVQTMPTVDILKLIRESYDTEEEKISTEEEKISKIAKLIKEKKIDKVNINRVVKFRPNKPSGTPLINAIEYKHPRLVEFLLKNGADANIIYNDSYRPPYNLGMGRKTHSPLMSACAINDSTIVKSLLPYCTDRTINMTHENNYMNNENGLTPYGKACANGNLKIVELLFPKCTDLTKNGRPNNSTPLFGTIEVACGFNDWDFFYNYIPRSKEKRLAGLEVLKFQLKNGTKVDEMSLNKAEKMVAENRKDDTISKDLLNYLKLADDYDNSSDKAHFLKDLLYLRENKIKNIYNLDDAYNILTFRSMIIKPLKYVKP